MGIRFATQADRVNIRVIKPVAGQLGAGSTIVCNELWGDGDCNTPDAPEPRVSGITKLTTLGKVRRTGIVTTPVACDCQPGYHSIDLPGGGCTCKKNPTAVKPPGTPPDSSHYSLLPGGNMLTQQADDDKIFGFPRWVVIGGGIAAGLWFLSSMGEVK
jgi:hypothetical protein